MRGDFVQHKQMKMFKQPLLSSGHFLLDNKNGLIWQQESPFPVALVLVKDKLKQQISKQPAQIILAKDNPMVFYFSHLFLSLFKGDIKQLEQQFSLTLSGSSEQWQLQLTPKSAPLNRIFEHIDISGAKYINQLKLVELSGDSSLLDFSQQRALPVQLNEEEKRAFKF